MTYGGTSKIQLSGIRRCGYFRSTAQVLATGFCALLISASAGCSYLIVLEDGMIGIEMSRFVHQYHHISIPLLAAM
jgi:hypothetical protein